MPKLTISDPVEGRELTAASTAAISIQFAATDDYGLASVGLYRSSNEKPDAELIQQWPAAVGQKTFHRQRESAALPVREAGRQGNHVLPRGQGPERPERPGRGLVAAGDGPAQLGGQGAGASGRGEQQAGGELAGVAQAPANQSDRHASGARSTRHHGGGLDRAAWTGRWPSAIPRRWWPASAEDIAPEVRANLRSLTQQEMPAAVLALRDAVAAATGDARSSMLQTAAKLETLILTKLQGVARQSRRGSQTRGGAGPHRRRHRPAARAERHSQGDFRAATPAAAGKLSDRQDQLADQSIKVRKDIEKNAGNNSLGDPAFRAGLTKIAGMFAEFKIYESMLTAADAVELEDHRPTAASQETAIVAEPGRRWSACSANGRWRRPERRSRPDAQDGGADQGQAREAGRAPARRGAKEQGTRAQGPVLQGRSVDGGRNCPHQGSDGQGGRGHDDRCDRFPGHDHLERSEGDALQRL